MIYAAVIEDRHTNPKIKLFRTREKAIEYCRGVHEERTEEAREDWPDIYAELQQEWNKDAEANELWYYSTEGDCVYVVELEEPV